MMELSVDSLFDRSHTEHREIFDEVTYPWQIIGLIVEYLQYTLEHHHLRIEADATQAAYIGKNVAVGKGTVIEPGVVIHGPTIIGSNCILRTNAYIRGNAIIGNHCVIGNSTEIKNSFLCNDVTAPHYNYIGDSVLGYKVHLGAGVILSNIKTPPSEIVVKTLEQTYRTGLTKFGALIGDFTEVGCNAVLTPGTIVGKHCSVYPLALVRGIIASGTIVKVRQQQEIVIKRV